MVHLVRLLHDPAPSGDPEGLAGSDPVDERGVVGGSLHHLHRPGLDAVGQAAVGDEGDLGAGMVVRGELGTGHDRHPAQPQRPVLHPTGVIGLGQRLADHGHRSRVARADRPTDADPRGEQGDDGGGDQDSAPGAKGDHARSVGPAAESRRRFAGLSAGLVDGIS